MSGEIPGELGLNPLLASLRLDHNEFTGPIPPALGVFGLENLDLSFNNLSGECTFVLSSQLHPRACVLSDSLSALFRTFSNLLVGHLSKFA